MKIYFTEWLTKNGKDYHFEDSLADSINYANKISKQYYSKDLYKNVKQDSCDNIVIKSFDVDENFELKDLLNSVFLGMFVKESPVIEDNDYNNLLENYNFLKDFLSKYNLDLTTGTVNYRECFVIKINNELLKLDEKIISMLSLCFHNWKGKVLCENISDKSDFRLDLEKMDKIIKEILKLDVKIENNVLKMTD